MDDRRQFTFAICDLFSGCRMRSVQRLLKTQNPRIAEVNIEDLVDNC
jgi:hypothetical protein